MNIWLLYCGGHAKQCIDVFFDSDYTIKGAFDDNIERIGKEFYRGIKIVDTISNSINYIQNEDNVFCTIGDNKIRELTANRFSHYNWANCISKHSYISPSVKMGFGNYIGTHSKLLADTSIGNFNIINDGSTLTHDNTIINYNHIAPNASLGGRVNIGSNCLIGTNSTVNPNIKIVDNIIVGSGSIVVKDILYEGVYKGIVK